MEKNVENNFDTDLDDDDDDKPAEQNYRPKSSGLSFNKKLAAHRSNRLHETFGQIKADYELPLTLQQETNDETLVPLRCKTPSNNTRLKIYEECCQILDITSDWQIRGLLDYDTIVLSDRPFSFNDFRAFSTAIDINLKNLTLHSVGLTSRSIHVLCQGLKKCIHLNLLDLSDNKIGRQGFDYLINVLNYLPYLHYLSLANCSIQDSYGIHIGDLCRHKNLIELNLYGNEFEENACIFIGNALTDNTCLLYLNLSWNLIRSYASIALFRGIEVNLHLTELDISWSGLSYDGSIALRRVLSVNKVLQRLNISNCSIEWISVRMISEGLAKNSTLQMLNLSYNPITTHGVHCIVQAVNVKTNVVSMLDISGITVYSTSVRLAEKISQRREFIMKYDCEIPVHDILGQQTTTKGDSMRKIIQHIDERNWRTLEYFRMLDKQNKSELDKKKITFDILKSGIKLEREDIQNIHNRLTQREIQPLTYQNLNMIINQQRKRDRLLKIRQEKEANDLKKRNRKILQTVSHHFPGIEILSRYEKHQNSINKLSKPRAYSANPRANSFI